MTTTAQLPKRSSARSLDLNSLFDENYPAHFYGHFGMEVRSKNNSSDSKINYAELDRRIKQRLEITRKRYRAKNRIKSVIEHGGVKVTVIATGVHRSILVESTENNVLYQAMLAHMQNIKFDSYKGASYNCVTVVAELLEKLQAGIIGNAGNWTVPWLLDRRIKPEVITKRNAKNSAQLGFRKNRLRSYANNSSLAALQGSSTEVTAPQVVAVAA